MGLVTLNKLLLAVAYNIRINPTSGLLVFVEVFKKQHIMSVCEIMLLNAARRLYCALDVNLKYFNYDRVL